MKRLNNIYNRNDFLKVNEGDVNTYGEGQGAMSSFSNNLSLQHTYLGKLLDGMFKSITWLWRKSKENFTINKLMGQLTNELLRGVITYCFANGINIKTGQELISSSSNREGEISNNIDQIDTDQTNKTIDKQKKHDFSIIQSNIKDVDWDNPKPEYMTPIFGFPFDIKNANIKDDNIEAFKLIVKDMNEYLNDNYENYLKLKEKTDESSKKQVQKYEDIYKNFYFSSKIIENYENNKSVEVEVQESYKSVNEFKNAPMSSPVAGADPKAKKIKTKVKVKQILTKRDREKYKKLENELNLSIADINLAGIENEVVRKKSKDDVSQYVNAENLRAIQLTAENLFYPERTSLYKKPGVEDKTVEKQRLKTKWQKEVNKVLANFSDLMNTDEIRKHFSDNSKDSEGLVEKVQNRARNIKQDQNANIGFDKLEKQGLLISDEGKVTFAKLKGEYAMMYFISNSKFYMATVADVWKVTDETNGDAILLRICNTFDPEDTAFNKSNFVDFKRDFVIGDNYSVDVYFLIFKPRVMTSNKESRMLILNYDNKKEELKLFNFSNKIKYDAITVAVNNKEKAEDLYKENITSIGVKKLEKFVQDLGIEFMEKFGFMINGNQIDYKRKVPSFYKDEIKEFLMKMYQINQNKI